MTSNVDGRFLRVIRRRGRLVSAPVAPCRFALVLYLAGGFLTPVFPQSQSPFPVGLSGDRNGFRSACSRAHEVFWVVTSASSTPSFAQRAAGSYLSPQRVSLFVSNTPPVRPSERELLRLRGGAKPVHAVSRHAVLINTKDVVKKTAGRETNRTTPRRT
jgi:hypothetical protein